MSYLRYRPEIDGLRAIAVIPVILFHAGLDLFSGGYVGVDVFFVISGYLITTIILKETEAGTFSLLNFYERRARRILPALFFVMTICSFFAWIWLLPDQFRGFSQSLVAVSVFVSNIFFWQDSGYFSTAAELKPLLHTWSLAVEEQYYVLFPLFFMLMWRFGKNWLIATLTLIAVLSLGLAQWGSLHAPTATFFLLPTRGWELLIGVLVAFYLFNKDVIKGNQPLSILGLSMIGYSIFEFGTHTPFPSIYALIPTLGTALVILFATPSTIAHRLLSNKILVGVGLISYSAYLWHQPMFAFARHKSALEPSLIVMLSLGVGAIILAFISWKFVETPFRQKRFSRRSIFSMAFVASSILVIVGLVLSNTSNYARLNDYERQIIRIQEQSELQRKTANNRGTCFFDFGQTAETLLDSNCVKESEKKRLIIFGDSLAAQYVDGFVHAFSNNDDFEVFQWTGTSCRAINYSTNSVRCKHFLDLFETHVLDTLTGKDTIIVASNWFRTHQTIGTLEFKQELVRMIKNLRNSGARVVIFGGTPIFVRNPFIELIRIGSNPDEIVYLHSKDFITADILINSVANDLDIEYLSPSDDLCIITDSIKCLFRNEEFFLFFDEGHFTIEGSIFVVNTLLSKLFE